MFIDDEELRSLYEVASAEHLQEIEAGLLQLEKNPDDLSPLKVLLREAHSLKGDSRMLGVEDAETVVHQMEEILMAIDRQETLVTPQLFDALYQGLDAVKRIAQEAVTGEAAGVQLFEIIATLMIANGATGETDQPLTPVDLAASEVPQFNFAAGEFASSEFAGSDAIDWQSFAQTTTIDQPPAQLPTEPAGDWLTAALAVTPLAEQLAPVDYEDLNLASSEELDALENPDSPETASEQSVAKSTHEPHPVEVFEINTIRVPASKLERLMIQADELAVAKLRIAQRHEDLLALHRLWEDWSRIAPVADQRFAQFSNLLNQMRVSSTEDTARLESVANDLESGIRQIRMLPLQTVFALFPRMVRDLAKQQGKEIDLVIEGGDVLADKQILEALKDPLTHILRNAIDHGIETPSQRGQKSPIAQLKLKGVQRGNQIEIIISDDGRGLDLAAIRKTAIRRGLYTNAELDRLNPEQIQSLIFVAGFSTRTSVTEISGRGVGMDVARANIEKLKGSIKTESIPGQGCTFRILLNNSLATVNALILQVNQQPFALALDAIETMQFIDRSEIFTLDGKLTVHWQERGVSVAWLADLLELPLASPTSTLSLSQVSAKIPCVFIKIDGEYLGILVDELLEQQQIVVKTLNQLLSSVRNLSGASILGNGEICMVLNPQALFQAAGGRAVSQERRALLVEEKAPPSILLVEDSLPIRTQVKRILEGAGYNVTAAVDGLDGLNKLQAGSFAAVVSDVEMPNMTGLELTSHLRTIPEYSELPVILVTTLAKDEHRRQGVAAGASAYLTKGNFDQSLLLNTLRRLVIS